MEGMDECGNYELIVRLLYKLRLEKSAKEPESILFKSEGCFLLGLLSRNGVQPLDFSDSYTVEYARGIIIDAGGLDYILSLVKDPSCCLTSLRYCCYAIGNLVTSLTGICEES